MVFESCFSAIIYIQESESASIIFNNIAGYKLSEKPLTNRRSCRGCQDDSFEIMGAVVDNILAL